MKVAILAGGRGTRLADPDDRDGIVPKPMVRIDDHPILWHILKHYQKFGFNDFVIATGFMSEKIETYFNNSDEDWNVECIDTGLDTNTGGRIKRLAEHIGNERFMLTWGDGISDLDINELLAFHNDHGKLCTLTAVHPPARFGELTIEGNAITEFQEKPKQSDEWINGAFFVCEPGIFDYIESDSTLFEGAPLQNLAKDGELMAFKYEGFWKCMDSPKDRDEFRSMCENGTAPWKENT
jgi:glucose-1-phosphate cytidylyltransferase